MKYLYHDFIPKNYSKPKIKKQNNNNYRFGLQKQKNHIIIGFALETLNLILNAKKMKKKIYSLLY